MTDPKPAKVEQRHRDAAASIPGSHAMSDHSMMLVTQAIADTEARTVERVVSMLAEETRGSLPVVNAMDFSRELLAALRSGKWDSDGE